MNVSTYAFSNHNPEDRLRVRVVEDETDGSWLLISPEGENERALQVGLTQVQARDLSMALFRKAAEAEAIDAAAAVRKAVAEAKP